MVFSSVFSPFLLIKINTPQYSTAKAKFQLEIANFFVMGTTKNSYCIVTIVCATHSNDEGSGRDKKFGYVQLNSKTPGGANLADKNGASRHNSGMNVMYIDGHAAWKLQD